MNEEAIKAIWEQDFKDRVPYPEFRKEFDRPDVRNAIHTEYYKERVGFDQFETDLGFGQQPKPKQTTQPTFWDKMGNALSSGWDTGKTLTEGMDYLTKGKDLTDEDKIALGQIMQSRRVLSDEESFAKIRSEHSEGFKGFMELSTKEKAGYVSEIALQSGAMMLRGFFDGLTNKKTAGVLAAGAAAGVATGSAIPIIGNLLGGGLGAFATVSGMTEASSVYFDEMQVELDRKGLRGTPDEMGEIAADGEWRSAVRKRAAARGITIFATDFVSGMVSGGIGAKAASAIKGMTAFGAAKTIAGAAAKAKVSDVLGGAGGERGAQIFAGEEYDPVAVEGEILGELFGAPYEFVSPFVFKQKGREILAAKELRNAADKTGVAITNDIKQKSETALSVGNIFDGLRDKDTELVKQAYSDVATRLTREQFVAQVSMLGEAEGLSAEEIAKIVTDFDTYKQRAEKFNTPEMQSDPSKTDRAVKLRTDADEVDAQIAENRAKSEAADPVLKPQYDKTDEELTAKKDDLTATLEAVVSRKETPVEDSPEYYRGKIDEGTTLLETHDKELADVESELAGIARLLDEDAKQGGTIEQSSDYTDSKSQYLSVLNNTLIDQKENSFSNKANISKLEEVLKHTPPPFVLERIGGDKIAGKALIQKAKDLLVRIKELQGKYGENNKIRNQIKEYQSRFDALTADIGDVEYNSFIDKNIVSAERMQDIALKVKENKPLTQRETAVFQANTGKINDIIGEKPAAEQPTTVPEPILPEKPLTTPIRTPQEIKTNIDVINTKRIKALTTFRKGDRLTKLNDKAQEEYFGVSDVRKNAKGTALILRTERGGKLTVGVDKLDELGYIRTDIEAITKPFDDQIAELESASILPEQNATPIDVLNQPSEVVPDQSTINDEIEGVNVSPPNSAETETVLAEEPLTQTEERRINEIAEAKGIRASNLIDLFKINRQLFKQNVSKSIAAATVMDALIGNMAKRAGITKAKMYDQIEFRKALEAPEGALTQEGKGATDLAKDGTDIIYALTDPDVSTPVNALVHVFEHYLTEAESKSVLKGAGTETWTTETSEYFARGFERFLAEGISPNKPLENIFKQFKQWLTEIYKAITGSPIDVQLNVEMENLYASMLSDEDFVIKPLSAEKFNNKAIDDFRREVLEDMDELSSDYKSVTAQIKDAMQNHVSAPEHHWAKEQALAFDAINGKVLDGPMQLAIANAINKLKQERSVLEQQLRIQQKKNWGLGSGVSQYKANIEEVDEVLEILTRGLRRAGTSLGRALAIRKELIEFNRMSFEVMKEELTDTVKEVNTNWKINKDDETFLRENADRIAQLQKEIQALDRRNKTSNQAVKEMVAGQQVKANAQRQTQAGYVSKVIRRSSNLKGALAQLDKVLKGDIC